MILLLGQSLDYSIGVMHSLAGYLESSVTSVMHLIDRLAKWHLLHQSAEPKQRFLPPLVTEHTQVMRTFHTCILTAKEALISGRKVKMEKIFLSNTYFKGKK